MTAYAIRALLGLAPEAYHQYHSRNVYHHPAMQPMDEKYGIKGLRIGLSAGNFTAKVQGSVLFGYPSIWINPNENGLINAKEFVLRHEIAHISYADTNIRFLLFGTVAVGTSMAMRYRYPPCGSMMKRIYGNIWNEGFSLGMGAMAFIGYSRLAEKRADATASQQCSREERISAIQSFQQTQNTHKTIRNWKQVHIAVYRS
jgi:hypothetical protein